MFQKSIISSFRGSLFLHSLHIHNLKRLHFQFPHSLTGIQYMFLLGFLLSKFPQGILFHIIQLSTDFSKALDPSSLQGPHKRCPNGYPVHPFWQITFKQDTRRVSVDCQNKGFIIMRNGPGSTKMDSDARKLDMKIWFLFITVSQFGRILSSLKPGFFILTPSRNPLGKRMF